MAWASREAIAHWPARHSRARGCGADGLPIYDPNEETDVTVTYKVNGKDVTVHGKQLSDKEIQAIKDYIKTLPEKNKEDDKQ